MMDSLFPINFSNSMLSGLSCELRWYRSNCQKLSFEKKNSDLIAGGHFAKGCEIIRRSYFNEGLSVEEAIELGIISILEGEDTGDMLKSNDRMAQCLEKYFKRFPLDNTLQPCRLVDNSYAIEYDFEFDLGLPHPELSGVNLKYKGKLDMLAEREISKGVYHIVVVDEKTTKTVSRVNGTKSKSHPNGIPDLDKETNSYRTDSQLLGYHWAARQLGIKTQEGLIRKVPILTQHEDAFELIVPVTQYQIDMWYETMINTVSSLLAKYNQLKKHNALPYQYFLPVLNGYGCTNFGERCRYMEGCLTKHGENILESTFQQTVWDSAKQESITLKQYKEERGL